MNIDALIDVQASTANALGGMMAPDLDAFEALEALGERSITDASQIVEVPAEALSFWEELITLTKSVGTEELDNPDRELVEEEAITDILAKVGQLYVALRTLSGVDVPDIPESMVELVVQNRRAMGAALSKFPSLFADLMQEEFTESDLRAVAYRRGQVQRFRALLTDESAFQAERDQLEEEGKRHGPEDVWQAFFEQNQWVFGYGLNYVFNESIETFGSRLEVEIDRGAAGEPGDRVDGLLKTAGEVQSVCFVEIKTHQTDLLYFERNYRSGVWRVSTELAGAVSQIQTASQRWCNNYGTRRDVTTRDGEVRGEVLFSYQPKTFVVIGALSQFNSEYPGRINEQKFGSFQLFRRGISNPEIITFDELFLRALHIIDAAEDPELKLPAPLAELPPPSHPSPEV